MPAWHWQSCSPVRSWSTSIVEHGRAPRHWFGYRCSVEGSNHRRHADDLFEEAVRAEAEEVEASAEALRRRGLTLSNAVADLAARGDRVRAECGHTYLTGFLSAAVGDLAILVANETEASLHLSGPLIMSLVEESRTGGHVSRAGARSFRARLSEFEMSGEPVTIIGPSFSEHGVIGAVAADHVVLDRGSGEMYVPIRMIGWVTRPTPRPGGAD